MSDAQNPQYPTKLDKEVQQLFTYEHALHGVIVGFKSDYPSSGVHQIGEALKMAQALAHDIEWLCEGLFERYTAADEHERAARLLSE